VTTTSVHETIPPMGRLLNWPVSSPSSNPILKTEGTIMKKQHKFHTILRYCRVSRRCLFLSPTGDNTNWFL